MRPTRALSPLASLVLASLAACASPVRVEVSRNGAPADALVRLTVYETDATCAELGSLAGVTPLYDAALPGRDIGALGDRPYLFVATARDRSSCEVRWRGCTAVRGTTRDPVRVVLSSLEPVEGCPSGTACGGDGECVGAPEDAGVDGGMDARVAEDGGLDAGASDGGLDAGFDGAIPDAGSDAGSLEIEGCSDEFEREALGAGWTIEPGGDSPRVELLGGALLLEPEAGGWYQAYTGLFVRRDTAIAGDVMLQADVEVTRGDELAWPTQPFNTVGLLMRPTGQTAMWALIDLGMQQTETGALAKWTHEAMTELSSVRGTATRRARLRLCRVGTTIAAYASTGGGTSWALLRSDTDAQLAEPLDVGVMATGWNATGEAPNTTITPDVRGLVRSLSCRRIASLDDCASP